MFFELDSRALDFLVDLTVAIRVSSVWQRKTMVQRLKNKSGFTAANTPFPLLPHPHSTRNGVSSYGFRACRDYTPVS